MCMGWVLGFNPLDTHGLHMGRHCLLYGDCRQRKNLLSDVCHRCPTAAPEQLSLNSTHAKGTSRGQGEPTAARSFKLMGRGTDGADLVDART